MVRFVSSQHKSLRDMTELTKTDGKICIVQEELEISTNPSIIKGRVKFDRHEQK